MSAASYQREYYWRNRDRLLEQQRGRYAEDAALRDGIKAKSADRHQRFMSIIAEAKIGPCVGVQLPPECMDLDHMRGEKLFAVGAWKTAKVPAGKTREQILRAEIAKCDVRCPNCHRLRHYRAANTYNLTDTKR